LLTAHLVSHTHWDREWYHPVERFRQRLVALVDELIDDPPGGHQSFLLDGQTIVLDDYLAVRPDRASELYQLLRDGRLEAGPWFVLADELIPGGEALVRNLLTGRRTLRRIGVEAPPVLYCPDSFGHPAALPAIATGFGLPLIILWRGFGGARWPKSDVVRWIAPSGDEALVYHLPRDGYEFGSHLPIDAQGAAARWQRMRAELAPRSATGVVLIANGADHHARQSHLREATTLLAAAARPDVIHPSSLRAFAEQVVATARSVDRPIPVVSGELRDSYGYTWTLQGTFATRAHEKRANARAERLLVREAEPWAALAARVGPSRLPLVEAAWRTLLEAHPHDTLCGCSIDEVADAMELRIRSATNQAVGVRDDAILQLVGHDLVEAREARDRWTPTVIVRNPAPRPRGGVVIVDDETFLADIPVGPGSAAGVVPRPETRSSHPAFPDEQLLASEFTHALTESPRHYPDNDLVAQRRVALWVAPVPAYGLAAPLSAESRPRQDVTASQSSIENAFWRVEVRDHGVIAFEDKTTGNRVESIVEPLTEADAGDTYTPAPRQSMYSIDLSATGSRARGPLIGDVVLGYVIRRDAARPIDPDVEARRAERMASDFSEWPAPADAGTTHLTVRFILEADAPWVRIEVTGENRLDDHRLRLRFRGGVRGEVWADAAFGPVRREPLVVSAADSAMEIPPETAPLHRYVSRFDDERGYTVFSDGLAEYEATDDGSIIVTLLRAVGQLSASNLPERPGHAGWPKQTPGAECHGRFAGSFAIMFHGPRTPDVIDAVERAADDILLPLRGATLRSALRAPDPVHGVELQGLGLALSAIKESEDGRWLVLRCINLLDTAVAGSWTLPFDVVECLRARLDETPMQGLSSVDRVVAFEAEPRATVTILVR
jgi:mannosylglycerate hydrolase